MNTNTYNFCSILSILIAFTLCLYISRGCATDDAAIKKGYSQEIVKGKVVWVAPDKE